jgi:hypothetical protein
MMDAELVAPCDCTRAGGFDHHSSAHASMGLVKLHRHIEQLSQNITERRRRSCCRRAQAIDRIPQQPLLYIDVNTTQHMTTQLICGRYIDFE